MKTFSKLSGVAVIAVLAPVTAAFAQDDFELGEMPPPKPPAPFFTNFVELGVGYQSRDSFFFGRYGGVADEGPFPIASASLRYRPAWDSGDTTFWDASARLYGVDTRSVQARYGRQGSWRVSAFYDAFTRFYTESGRSPFNGIGTANLTLPSNWIGTGSSLVFPALAQDLKPFELKTQWQTVGGDYLMNPATGYEVRLHFDHRHRDGLKAQSLPFGQEANYPVGVFFPQPVDYDTNRLNASIGYADPRLQWSASYALSMFRDGLNAVTVQNPYARSLGTPWTAGAFAGFPFAFGQYSLPPDSTAHQFALTGGYAATPKTRVTVRVAYTLQNQNDPFLPYTTTPQLTVVTPVPRASLNGKDRKTYASFNVTSREWAKWDFLLNYTFDDRDNRSPRDLYSYVANDAQDQIQPALPGNSRYIRYNLPYSFTSHQAKLEAGYRLTPRTRLSITYTGDFKYRTYQEVNYTAEHAVKAKAATHFTGGVAWASYSYATRTGSNYADNRPWNLSHTESYLDASPNNQSIGYPLLRKYNLADRHRQETKGGVTDNLTPALSADVSGGYARDNYYHSLFGLRHTDSMMIDGDVSYAIKDRVTASVFYSFERIRSDQKGYYLATINLSNPAQEWGAQNKDYVHTAGAKVDWQVVPQKIKLGAAYYLASAATHIGVQATPFTLLSTVAPLPHNRELTHNGNVRADYTWRPNTIFRVGYTVEHHVSADWQYDNLGVAPVAQILGAGIIPPRYTVHVISVSARYEF